MKELMKKYGFYEFYNGNLYLEITDEKISRPTLKDVLVSFCGDVIILTATKMYYSYFTDGFFLLGRTCWNKGYENYYDLEGKSIDEITRKSWFLRKRIIKSWTDLKLKKTEELHLESTNWTLKILDFENGKLLKKDFNG